MCRAFVSIQTSHVISSVRVVLLLLLHFAHPHVRRTLMHGQDQVHQKVEGDESDQQVIGHRRQTGFVQVHGEEDGHDADDVGRVADEPMHPIEQGSSIVVGGASQHGDQGLYEAQSRGDDPQQGVRILAQRDLGPAVKLQKDEHEAG